MSTNFSRFLVATASLFFINNALAENMISIPLSSTSGICPSDIKVYVRDVPTEATHIYTADIKRLVSEKTIIRISYNHYHRFENMLNFEQFPNCTAAGSVMLTDENIRMTVTVLGGLFIYEFSSYSGFLNGFPYETENRNAKIINNQPIVAIGYNG